jgi:antitoxin (DNA-binding transcriptional repressor) of toxin-antitoxin stability system
MIRSVRKSRKQLGTALVTATEAAKNFGAIVHHVREARAEYTVERGGLPVARIVPVFSRGGTVGDLVGVIRRSATADPSFGAAVTDGVRAINRREVPRDPWGS